VFPGPSSGRGVFGTLVPSGPPKESAGRPSPLPQGPFIFLRREYGSAALFLGSPFFFLPSFARYVFPPLFFAYLTIVRLHPPPIQHKQVPFFIFNKFFSLKGPSLRYTPFPPHIFFPSPPTGSIGFVFLSIVHRGQD